MNIANLKTVHTLRLSNALCNSENDLISLLIQLPLLTKLDLDMWSGLLSSVVVIDAIKEYNIPIKELSLIGFKINSLTFQSLFKLKSLTALCLKMNRRENARVSENDLVLLVSMLPSLMIFEFSGRSADTEMSITVNGLKKMQSGRQLNRIILNGIKG